MRRLTLLVRCADILRRRAGHAIGVTKPVQEIPVLAALAAERFVCVSGGFAA
jgi:hypothetical protein